MNWYKTLILSQLTYKGYSKPGYKGEGRGGVSAPTERHLDNWINEHREEVRKMKSLIKGQDWEKVKMYQQQLMDYYKPPHNEQIVKGIISAAMSGQKF